MTSSWLAGQPPMFRHTRDMTSRLGTNGQVVIPKTLRDRLGITPGDEVDILLHGDAVLVIPVRERPSLRGTSAGSGLIAELESSRRVESAR